MNHKHFRKNLKKQLQKSFKKDFKKVFTNHWKHDIINISDETKTKNKLKKKASVQL